MRARDQRDSRRSPAARYANIGAYDSALIATFGHCPSAKSATAAARILKEGRSHTRSRRHLTRPRDPSARPTSTSQLSSPRQRTWTLPFLLPKLTLLQKKLLRWMYLGRLSGQRGTGTLLCTALLQFSELKQDSPMTSVSWSYEFVKAPRAAIKIGNMGNVESQVDRVTDVGNQLEDVALGLWDG